MNDNNCSNGEEFSVEKIVGKMETSEGIRYLVKWLTYPEEDNSWEDIETLLRFNCRHLILKYERDDNPDLLSPDIEIIPNPNQKSDTIVEEVMPSISQVVNKTNPVEDIESHTKTTDNSCDDSFLSCDTEVDSSYGSCGDQMTDNVTQTEDKEEEESTKDMGIQTESEDPDQHLGQDLEAPAINTSLKTAVYTGFVSGLIPDKIMGASFDGKNIYFFMRWTNNHISIVCSEEAKVICPQIVIQFYQGLIHYN